MHIFGWRQAFTMNKLSNFLYIILPLFLSCCSLVSQKNEFKYEVSNYISKDISEIPIYVKSNNISVVLANASSAEKILLHFIVNPQFTKELDKLTIKCMSQCGIEFVGDADKIKVEQLYLFNAHLLNNSQMQVKNFFLHASEAIKTGLPVVLDRAKIEINSSPNMLEVRKLLAGVNIIPSTGEFIYDTKIIYNKNKQPINCHNDQNISDADYNTRVLVKTFPDLKWVAPVVSWFAFNKYDSWRDNIDISQLEIMPGVENNYQEASEIWLSGDYNRKNAYLVSKDSNNRSNYGGTINDESLVRYIESLRSKSLKIMFYPMIMLDLPNKPWRGFIKAHNPDDIHNFLLKKGDIISLSCIMQIY